MQQRITTRMHLSLHSSVWLSPQQQIIDHALPTKPVKATQSRKKYDIDQTVEAEAMRPDTVEAV